MFHAFGRSEMIALEPLKPVTHIVRRREVEMDFKEIVLNFTEGDLVSARAWRRIARAASVTDPRYPPGFGGVSHFFLEDNNWLRLYGGKAEILLFNICRGDDQKAAAIMRSCQLQHVSLEELHSNLNAAEAGQKHSFDVDVIVRRVQNSVPGYMKIIPDIAGAQGSETPIATLSPG
jgi:hypothetical protein